MQLHKFTLLPLHPVPCSPSNCHYKSLTTQFNEFTLLPRFPVLHLILFSIESIYNFTNLPFTLWPHFPPEHFMVILKYFMVMSVLPIQMQLYKFTLLVCIPLALLIHTSNCSQTTFLDPTWSATGWYFEPFSVQCRFGTNNSGLAKRGVAVGREERATNIRYPDDLLVYAIVWPNWFKYVQIIRLLCEEFAKIGLRLNLSNTKLNLTTSANDVPEPATIDRGFRRWRSQAFKYLGRKYGGESSTPRARWIRIPGAPLQTNMFE